MLLIFPYHYGNIPNFALFFSIFPLSLTVAPRLVCLAQVSVFYGESEMVNRSLPISHL